MVYQGRTLEYEGIFSLRELIDMIKDLAGDKGYFPFEPKHAESIKEEGKYLFIEISLKRKLSDYARGEITLNVEADNVKEKIVTLGEQKKKVHDGKLKVSMDAALITDYEQRWETKPLFWTMRKLFEMYIYSPVIGDYRNSLKADADWVFQNVRSYLNLAKT